MSSGRDGADERFAAAWDEQVRARDTGRPAQTTPPLGEFSRGGNDSGSGGRDRTVDTDLADDLRIADLLRGAAAATPGPDAAASARMRASVMASITGQDTGRDAPRSDDPGVGPDATPRTAIVPSTATAATATAATPSGPASHGRRRAERRGATRPGDGRPASASARSGRSAMRRLASTTVAGVAAVLALGALTVLLSRGALPGDMLYGLKRASESTEIGLTSGQEAKGQKHLDIAALRLSEIQELIQRDAATAAGPRPTAAGLDDAQAGLVADNLRAFDEQARTGSKMLLGLVNRPSGPSATTLSSWAGQQHDVLAAFSPSLPPSGQERAASSQRLLGEMRARAAALATDPSCGREDSDDLGPLPSATCSTSRSDSAPTSTTPESTTSTPESTTRATTSTAPTTTVTSGSTTTSTDTSSTDTSSTDTTTTTTTPDPVKVPVPVPGLPKVELPPLLPGLPGLSLG